MKQFKGTKGKWKSSDSGYVHVEQQGKVDKYIVDPDTTISKKELKHNANLIAAAPELLRVVQSMQLSMMAHPDYQSGRNQELVDYVDIAEEVINKALGL